MPTRGSNTLDLVITNQPSRFVRCETLPGISDHDVMFVVFDIELNKNHQRPKKIPLYGKAKWDNVKSDLDQIYDSVSKMRDINIKRDFTQMYTPF